MVAADHVNFYNTCDKEIHGPKMYFKPKLGQYFATYIIAQQNINCNYTTAHTLYKFFNLKIMCMYL